MAQRFPLIIRRSLLSIICFALVISLKAWSEAAPDLPQLGGSGIFSSQQEEAIGRQVLQSIHRSAPLVQDPLVLDYLHDVVYRLVPYAPLQDRDLHLIIIDDPALNAFAVPGGVIGVNGGLFLNAKTEQQFAAVMAHELAHLSQRHFARRLENQRINRPLAIAGMIAGIVLSAVTQSDLGIAAIASSQAAVAQNMLQYSRFNEAEADRTGMAIMAKAGFDPRGMPAMFQQMAQQARLQGNRPPEYLSTHPLPESRISDTANRAREYPETLGGDSLEYHLVRARLIVRYSGPPSETVKRFQDRVRQASEKDRFSAIPARYGLANALLAAKRPKEALTVLDGLLEEIPERITFLVTRAEALLALNQPEKAVRQLSRALERNPGNFPITRTLAQAMLQAGNTAKAVRLLEGLTRDYPHNASLWEMLAEAQVKARNIVDVHRARAEAAILRGDRDTAMLNLRQALEKAAGNPVKQEIIRQRMEHARKLGEDQPLG